jgi:hypothetical protein
MSAIREAVTLKVCERGKRVAVVVNYDSFRLEDDVAGEYADMVHEMEKAHYTRISRYTTSAFRRPSVVTPARTEPPNIATNAMQRLAPMSCIPPRSFVRRARAILGSEMRANSEDLVLDTSMIP